MLGADGISVLVTKDDTQVSVLKKWEANNDKWQVQVLFHHLYHS